jgi:hypothetical protein
MRNGNGSKWFTESSLLSKVVAGVLVGVLVFLVVGMIGFGSRVYAFMAEGPRFSSEDYLREENAQDAKIHAEYMPRDVYRSDMRRIEGQLKRIEEKLDDALNR